MLPLHLLISFHYYRTADLGAGLADGVKAGRLQVIADSGAYSVSPRQPPTGYRCRSGWWPR